MPESLSRLTLAVIFSFVFLVGTPSKATSQTYPIDCAILLCLSGGWRTSAPCTKARVEFIRRVTPWPIEPPLQIWRCPMGASYQTEDNHGPSPFLHDILLGGAGDPPQSFVDAMPAINLAADLVEKRNGNSKANSLQYTATLQPIRKRADIDISGAEFNFVRTIRVIDVRFAWQNEAGEDGRCERSARVTQVSRTKSPWGRSSIVSVLRMKCR